MITAVHGLTTAQLEAIAALEARVVAADGGRLKLEHGVLAARRADQVRDVLCWSPPATGVVPTAAERGGTHAGAGEPDQLIGFAGIYIFGGATPEIAGMVDPRHRRQGIATALLDAAAAACCREGHRTALLVVPRNDAGGAEFATRHGGRLDHSEHAMLLRGEPRARPAADPDSVRAVTPAGGGEPVTLRPLTARDVPRAAAILMEAFGHPMHDDHDAALTREDEQRLVLEQDGAVVGAMRTTLRDGTGSVYGFAVAAGRRGEGIGRAALARACLELRARGAERVRLEVAADNDRALSLYESVGFERVITEDYYALEV